MITHELQTKWTQKIVTSTTELTIVASPTGQTIVASPTETHEPQPCIITQEEDDMPHAPNQPTDNTRATWMTQTITQEFVQLAMDHTESIKISQIGATTEFAVSILDEEAGE